MVGQNSSHFLFIEGPLLEAIRNGDWFLLDNLDQAPGDVLERLNSLLESEPQLEIYEGSNNETLTRTNGGIHKDFRFIATNNTERRGHALSTALLNRCILLNLDRMDLEMDATSFVEDAKKVPAYDILCHILHPIQNRENLVSILVKFHSMACNMLNLKEITTITNYSFNIRNLITASIIILYELKTVNGDPVKSLTVAIQRCYCDSLLKKEYEVALWKCYQKLLRNEKFESSEIHIYHCDSISVCMPMENLCLIFLD